MTMLRAAALAVKLAARTPGVVSKESESVVGEEPRVLRSPGGWPGGVAAW
jgi:hypothetical protein